jgi:hypothetical protein
MKRSIYSTLLCVGFILSSCNQGNKNSLRIIEKDIISKRDSDLKKDSIDNKSKNKNNIVHFSPIKVDTIIGDIHISYLIQDNENIISTTSYDDKGNISITSFADRSVFISLRKNNKNILLNKEIKKTDFVSIIPRKEINKYKLSSFQITKIDNEEVTFFVNYCVPDTDDCYALNLVISNDGAFTVKQIDESVED